MVVKYLFIMIFVTILISCGGGGGGNNQEDNIDNISTTQGSSQKGPFVKGSIVNGYKLNDGGSRDTTNTISTTTNNNLGEFSFDDISWTGATEFVISGNYYDENTGFSNNSATLTAIVNVTNNANFTTNINIFTHLEAQRIKQLMQSGSSVSTAKNSAQNLIKNTFNLKLLNNAKLTELDLTSSTKNNDDNLELLKMSAAISKQISLIDDLSNILQDGNIDNADLTTLGDLSNNIPDDLTTIRQKIQDLDPNITPPIDNNSNNSKPILIDISNINKTYGDADFEISLKAIDMDNDSITFSNIVNDQNIATTTITNSTLTITIKNAGQTNITISANDNDGGVSTKTFTLSVAKKSLEITADNKNKIYGESDPQLTYSVNGLINTDVLSGAISRDIGENTGNYNITIGTLNNDNYDINFNSAVFNIGKKPITITADNKNKTFGELDPILTYNANNLVNNDVLNGNLERAIGENAGTYAINQGDLTNNNNPNYDITFNSATFTINKANQVISIGSNISKMYGDNSFTINPTNYTGSGTISYESSNTDTAIINSSGNIIIKNAGTTTIGVEIVADINYNSANNSLILTIDKKSIIITADNKNKDFGNNDPELTYSTSGLISGDVLTGLLLRENGELFGTYTIIQGTLNNSNNPNYNITFNTATFTINPNTATIPNLVSAVAGNSKVSLQWNIINNANYNLYYAKETFSGLSDIANYGTLSGGTLISNISTNSAAINNLTNNTQYYFVATSLINNIESTISNELSATPTAQINDTGITWSVNSNTSGHNTSCSTSSQDCSFGRDNSAVNSNLIKVGLGHAGFDFTKLDSNGNVLTNQIQSWNDSGSENAGTRWSCVIDNVTGYIWEVKNNDGTPPASESSPSVDNIHHKSNKYRWGGITSDGYNNQSGSYYSDWDNLLNGANNSNLCGINSWSIPTRQDLHSIVNYNQANPSIDADFFPNTQSYWYWSSTSQANDTGAWGVTFSGDYNYTYDRVNYAPVRLVYKP